MGTSSIRPGVAAAVVAVAVSALFTGAARATVSSGYAVTGAEYSATSTEGKFAGFATGGAGDDALWRADVLHQALTTSCLSAPAGCLITAGGSLGLVTRRGDTVTGAFTGGSITLVRQEPGCGKQVFHVVGQLTTSAGTAVFDVALTHYRVLIGTCQAVFATIGADPGDGIPGTLSF
jgi:hypothetical protein